VAAEPEMHGPEPAYIAPGHYRFASSVSAYEADGMIYLDFFQHDPETSDQLGVARVVIRPEVAKQLGDRLCTGRHTSLGQ
jgi:hypothetical protein